MENFGTKPGRSISLPYEMIRLWKRIQDRSSNIMRDNSCLKELDDRKAPGARLSLLDLKKKCLQRHRIVKFAMLWASQAS